MNLFKKMNITLMLTCCFSVTVIFLILKNDFRIIRHFVLKNLDTMDHYENHNADIRRMGLMIQQSLTPLHKLARYHSDVTESKFNAVLASFPHINQPNLLGQTPLHFAAIARNITLVKLLIAAGADPKIQEGSFAGGNTALQLMFAKADFKAHAFGKEIEEKLELEIMKLIIATGMPLEIKNDKGHTLLSLAARKGKRLAIQYLLSQGAHVNCKSIHNNTPLMVTIINHTQRSPRFDCVQDLIAANADLNNQNNFGESALHFAAQVGAHDIIDLLLKAGADQSIKNEAGQTYQDVLDLNNRKLQILTTTEIGR